MNRYAVMSIAAGLSIAAAGVSMAPCQAQFLKTLENSLLGGQNAQQGTGFNQPQLSLVGTVNLPPAQYMMTNVQTGQAFYVTVQNGQMFLGGQQIAPPNLLQNQNMAPQQPMQQQNGGLATRSTAGTKSVSRNRSVSCPESVTHFNPKLDSHQFAFENLQLATQYQYLRKKRISFASM